MVYEQGDDRQENGDRLGTNCPMNWNAASAWTTTRVGLARRSGVIPAVPEIGERQSTTEKSLRFGTLKISGTRYGGFRAPPPLAFLAAWADKAHARSPVTATTCRARNAPRDARRGCPRVARNGGFPAEFERLYTGLTWRILGWSSREMARCELLRGSR
jgi:hypothetical protein